MSRNRETLRGAADDHTGTVATRIAARIQEDIVRGDLKAGERLNEVVLATRYGVSRVPLREAFRIVEGLGLVEIRPFSGAFVSDLSIAEVVDVFEIHEALESVALRLALPLLTDEILAELEQIALKAEHEPNAWRFFELSNDFYSTLYGCVNRRHLLEALRKLVCNQNRYLFLFFSSLKVYEPDLPGQCDFVKVLRKRDADTALTFQRNWRRAQREFLLQHIGEGRTATVAAHRTGKRRVKAPRP